MTLLPLSANRMNMLMLRRRLVIARKGHKLLKDKQDELMRNFLELIDEIKGLRIRTEKVFIEAIRRFTLSTGLLPIEELEAIFIVPAISARVEISTTRLLNLRVPKFKVKFSGEILSYSLTNTLLELDGAMSDMEKALKLLIALAETEKKLSLLAREIEVTRRRVNALEYVMIPDLFETISFIRMKLEELERGNLTRLMKVKDIIAQKRGI